MKKFNLKELVSQLQEDHREFEMADTVSIIYKGNYQPIAINGTVRNELKIFRASFCIYDVYQEEYTADDYTLDVELLVIEEYSDSPYSIYINENGEVDTEEYDDISTIEVGNRIVLKVEDGFVTHYSIKELQDV
jgi:hypothetical protein